MVGGRGHLFLLYFIQQSEYNVFIIESGSFSIHDVKGGVYKGAHQCLHAVSTATHKHLNQHFYTEN